MDEQERLERRRLAHKRWREKNREKWRSKCREASKRYYQTDAGKARCAKWKAANPERAKEAAREGSQKYRTTPSGRLAHTLRNRVITALKGGVKSKSTEELVGCNAQELMAHIEAGFQPGMNWENHGEWHIDHVRPCASFDLTDPAQQQECFHYTNLQPLWANENLAKGARV